MSVLLQDAQTELWNEHGIHLPAESVSELVYADDTLSMSEKGVTIQKHLDCKVRQGIWLGVELAAGGVAVCKV